MAEAERLKSSDILYGVVAPLIVGLIIVAFPAIIAPWATQTFGMESPIPIILTLGFAQMIIFGVPLFLGLLWNRWAGGAAGFLLGSLWYVANAATYTFDYFAWGYTEWNFFRDVSLLGYIVNAILIGYIAGSLNKKSFGFKRMLVSSLTASIITGVFQFVLNYQFALEPARQMTLANPGYAFFIVIVPQIVLAIIVPVVAKVFTWYGIYPGGRA